jgi:hypothetical protein
LPNGGRWLQLDARIDLEIAVASCDELLPGLYDETPRHRPIINETRGRGFFRQLSPLFKADKATLAIAAQRDGSLRVTYAGWDDARVILGGSRSSWAGVGIPQGASIGGHPPDLRDLQGL